MMMHATITLDDFLKRNYENERECEYIDGHLEERTGGDMAHGLLHVETGAWFLRNRSVWKIECLMSYSVRVSPTRIRVPDLVVANDKFGEDIRTTPPLLCIEILAPEDTRLSLSLRCDDFLRMGVEYLWLLDPIERAAFTYTAAGLKLVDGRRLAVPNSPIYLDLPELFSALD